MFPIVPTIKNFPKILMILSLFVSLIMLIFTLLGCTKTSSTYSDLYLIEYSFNDTSSMFPLIETAYASSNNSDLVDMKIRIGYLGVCISYPDTSSSASSSTSYSSSNGLSISSSLNDDKDEMYCVNSNSKNLADLEEKFPGVSLYSSNSNTTTASLNLMDLSHQFSNKVTNPYLSMGAIALTVALGILQIYIMIPKFPMRCAIIKCNFIISICLCILLAGVSVWADVAVESGIFLVQQSSLSIIQATQGSKLKSMNWACFSLVLVYALCCGVVYLKDFRQSNKGKSKTSKNKDLECNNMEFIPRRENL